MKYFLQTNWLAVVLGAVFNMALGFFWYGPFFGKLWLKITGKNAAEIESRSTTYIIPFIASLISAYVLAVLIEGLAITIWWQGLVIGAVFWVGIGATATLTTGTFEDTPRVAWLLFTLYQIIVAAAEGLVFAVWNL